ncbi:hypothetical protein QF026_002560 [Streptomyces aurantiacus]|nr:hypothetical protein [Streptomyces aurantiacus]
MHDGAVERRGGGSGHVDGVHGPVQRGLLHGWAPAAAPALGERLLLGLVRVVRLGRRTPPPGAAPGQRFAPLFLVALVVLAEVLGEVVVGVPRLHEAEPDAQQAQPLRNRVDRRRGDHQQPEDGEQHEERHSEDVAHRVRQRCRRAPADEPARVPYRLHAVAARGRPAGDVDLAEHSDGEGGQADDDAPVGVGLLGVSDEPGGDDRQQYRHEQVEAAEGAGHQHLDEVAHRAAQVGPGPRGDDQREADQQQREAVLAMRRVEPFRASPYAAEHGADGVRDSEPEGAYELVHAPCRVGCRLRGRGFLGCGLLGRRLFRGSFLRGGLLRRSLRRSGRLLRGRLLGCGLT